MRLAFTTTGVMSYLSADSAPPCAHPSHGLSRHWNWEMWFGLHGSCNPLAAYHIFDESVCSQTTTAYTYTSHYLLNRDLQTAFFKKIKFMPLSNPAKKTESTSTLCLKFPRLHQVCLGLSDMVAAFGVLGGVASTLIFYSRIKHPFCRQESSGRIQYLVQEIWAIL